MSEEIKDVIDNLGTSFEEFKARKKEMDNSLADGDVNGIDSMFEYLAERARAGKTGRKE